MLCKDTIGRLAQSCVQNNPVVVLGSGSSVPHGIRGMLSLAEALRAQLNIEGQDELQSWQSIEAALERGDGLESALQTTSAPQSLIRKIVECTWHNIASDDLALLQRIAVGNEVLPLADLIQRLFASTNGTIHIVTPNYDRIAEYASDVADYIHATGFAPGLIRKREGDDPVVVRKGKYPARIVRIWKVHGSLDWFEDEQGQVVCLPLTDALPTGFSPLIVTPGVSKYERTHDEPFRSAIRGADRALDEANAVLCIGYGFRDRHIQPKLVERCQRKNVPLVVLAHALTDEAKQFLSSKAGTSYLAMESCDEGTRVFTHDYPEGEILQDSELWSFSNLKSLVF